MNGLRYYQHKGKKHFSLSQNIMFKTIKNERTGEYFPSCPFIMNYKCDLLVEDVAYCEVAAYYLESQSGKSGGKVGECG